MTRGQKRRGNTSEERQKEERDERREADMSIRGFGFSVQGSTTTSTTSARTSSS